MFSKITEWTIEKILPMGISGLFLLAFAESSFFPVPPDILLIGLALIEPKTSFYLATVATVGSVLGGMFGYFIGFMGGRSLLKKFLPDEKISLVHQYFNKYETWAIGIAGFTPIPYKIFTISAGVFYVNFRKFVLVSILSRGARFFLIGTGIFIFGEPIKSWLDEYFNTFSLFIILVIFIGFIIIKIYVRKKSH